MIGTLNNKEIEEVLLDQIIGRIGCHGNNRTYVVPVSYAYDGKYVYVLSRNGMKMDIMRQNPEICFEVEIFQDMGNWRTGVAWGVFKELVSEEDRKQALHALIHRRLPVVTSETVQLTSSWPFVPADINSIEGIVFRIALNEKSGRYEDAQGVDIVSKSFF